jgi:hypothetical protein
MRRPAAGETPHFTALRPGVNERREFAGRAACVICAICGPPRFRRGLPLSARPGILKSVMKSSPTVTITALIALSVPLSTAHAAVMVVTNRSDAKVAFETLTAGQAAVKHSLTPGDVFPVISNVPVDVLFTSGTQPRRYTLAPYSIDVFIARDGRLELAEVPLHANRPQWIQPKVTVPPLPPPAEAVVNGDGPHAAAPAEPIVKVPVMILADDLEPTVQAVWERRLRKRLAAASDVFEAHCRLRFEVVAVQTWTADEHVHDFAGTLADFERKVRPTPARLAIGYTGRYQWVRNERHLGGTRAPLCSHILIRGTIHNSSEPEQLEVLVHELGHFLGASHTLDGSSVMRPVLGDRQSRRASFRIGFDPLNTMVLCLVSEQLRRTTAQIMPQFPLETRVMLRDVYAVLDQAMPKDPAVPQHSAMLALPGR